MLQKQFCWIVFVTLTRAWCHAAMLAVAMCTVANIAHAQDNEALSAGDVELSIPFSDTTEAEAASRVAESRVFTSAIYDAETRTLRLSADQQHTDLLTRKLYKQLSNAFDDPGKKDLRGDTKRVSWRLVR